jgi:hypothetical protein
MMHGNRSCEAINTAVKYLKVRKSKANIWWKASMQLVLSNREIVYGRYIINQRRDNTRQIIPIN